MSAPTHRVFTATVRVAYREDGGLPDWDTAVVTVNGTAHRYPWHQDDTRESLVRRAVLDNYRVARIDSLERVRRGPIPGASFRVVAELE